MMNEHTRKLVKRVGIRGFNIDNPDYVYEISQSELEKFAELIIKECINAMENEDSYYGSWMGKTIKKHFFIE